MSCIMVLLIVLLTACNTLGGDDSPSRGSEENVETNASVITWDESPDMIVFQANFSGGIDADAFINRNLVPPCTIYGDNRIVWSVDGENGTDILFDIVDPNLIRDFVSDLTVVLEIYTYEEGADLAIPSSETPFIEVLTLAVNDTVHRTDSLGGWDTNYFEDIVNRCQNISQAPTLFEPDAIWVSANEIDYDTGVPAVFWDADAADLDLIDLANRGERVWVRGKLARILWNVIRTNPPNLQLNQGPSYLQMGVEVPNVTGQSPPAPSASSEG